MSAAIFRSEEGLALSDLVREIPGHVDLVGDGTVRVHGVFHDSRAVGPGDLFVARKGEKSDGSQFIAQAKARGASAVMVRRGDVDYRGVRATYYVIEPDTA